MVARAVHRYIRMSPRKVRYVLGALRGRTVSQAVGWLSLTDRRASRVVLKAIGAAVANARQQDPTLTEDGLLISRAAADGGPRWKRYRAAPFGRAVMIRKPTTHLTIEVDRAPTRGPRLRRAGRA